MKKFKLILSSMFLALTIVSASGGYAPVYANDDPQGTAEKKPAPPAPPPSASMGNIINAIMAALMSMI